MSDLFWRKRGLGFGCAQVHAASARAKQVTPCGHAGRCSGNDALAMLPNALSARGRWEHCAPCHHLRPDSQQLGEKGACPYLQLAVGMDLAAHRRASHTVAVASRPAMAVPVPLLTVAVMVAVMVNHFHT